MTLLTIIQNATDELNLPRPAAVVNNTNTTIRQMLSMANGSGLRMMKRYDFQRLIKEFTHTTLAAEDQGTIASVIGSDYDRSEGNSYWNRDTTHKLGGPYTPQEWQRDKGSITTTIREIFRFRGGNVFMLPQPAAGETIAGEYVSNEWVLDNDLTTTKAKFSEDTDTTLIDEDLFTLDVKWRWLRAHGFSYAEEKLEFEQRFSEETGADKSQRIIDLRVGSRSQDGRNVDRLNTPEGGFGQ